MLPFEQTLLHDLFANSAQQFLSWVGGGILAKNVQCSMIWIDLLLSFQETIGTLTGIILVQYLRTSCISRGSKKIFHDFVNKHQYKAILHILTTNNSPGSGSILT